MKVHVKGVTLIEVISSLVILTTVASITLPNLSRFLAQNRLDTALANIYGALQYARNYAVSHSSNVSICHLDSGNCKANWQRKLYVFEDKNANLVLDNNEYIIRVINEIDTRDKLTYPRKGITFRYDGSLNFMQSGSFVYCNKLYPDLSANRLTISQVGRTRIRDSDKCSVNTK